MYDDLFLFIKVAKYGSFTRAARELGVYQSTISRRISSLETILGIKLIVRTANHFELTIQAQQIFESLSESELFIQSKVYAAIENEDVIFGEIKVLLPNLAYKIVTPYIPAFMEKHPNLKVRLLYQNHEINLQKDFIDVAVIWGLPEQQAQKAKLIHRAKVIALCTPEYIEQYGFWADPADADKHNLVVPLRDHGDINNTVNIQHIKTGHVTPLVINNYQIACNVHIQVMELINSGKCISASWQASVKEELKAGKFVQVLPDYTFDEFSFYLIRRVDDDPRINAFAAFIEECFKNHEIELSNDDLV